MDKFTIKDGVQIEAKELIHALNILESELNLNDPNPTSIMIVERTELGKKADTMLTVKIAINVFYSDGNRNVKYVYTCFRDKNWSCSNTSVKIISDEDFKKLITIDTGVWFVLSKEGIVLQVLKSEKDAKDWRTETFMGYYKDCLVKMCEDNLEHWKQFIKQ